MFLSLKWKALITTTVMLVVLGLIFSFQSNHQLRNLFENQRWATQQKNHEEIRNLLVHAFDQLLKFSDVVPLMVNHEAEPIQSHHPIRNMIDQHAQYIQINWGVESILLYDHLGKPLKSWNSLLAEKTHALATQVAHTSTPMNNLLCKAQCYQVTTTPILLHNGQTFILQLITSLGEIHSSFKKLTNANIGILFKNTDSSPPSDRFIAKWGYTVASMTDLEVMTTLLNQASNIVDFDSLKETPKTFRYEGRVFELQLVYAGEGQSDPYYFMIVSDLTEDYERINASLNAHLNVTTATTMLFGLLVVILIWNLINRLTLSSNLLPLLCEGEFQHVRDQLEKAKCARWFPDELDKLERTEHQVSTQLESMHEKIEEDKKRLEKLAMIDNVTQLGTRHNLYETCRRTIAEQPANDDTQFGILFIDIDNFKRVNDSMGHRYGDELLKTAGDRISNSVRQGDLVCRIGGDEFCVLAFGLKETKQIEQIADNILNALRIPLFINSKQLLVSASIGVVTYPKHGSNVEELLQHADIALHKAKFLGKNKIHLFSSEMDIKAKNDIALESDLSNAIKNQEFTLYYQPKIDLVSGKLVGAEALTRWNHPQKGLIPPYQFIPFLEESGLILVVGHWVIKEALRQSNEWRKILGRDIGIAINLSYRQFLDPYLFEKIETAIEDTQIPPHLVEIELTESMMMEDFETHNKTIEQLKSLGIQIAMDDFGTGYSSLAYLKKLSMDILKIDRSFVQDLPKDKNSMEIVSAIIAMSHKLRLKVVAEGIEEVEQHAFLKDNLCELGQGYLFSKPLPNDQFIQLAKDWEKNKKPLP